MSTTPGIARTARAKSAASSRGPIPQSRIQLPLSVAKGWPTVARNWILDCGIGPLEDAADFARAVRAIPGVVDTGLFLGTADTVVVADGGAVRERRRG